jgi:hypothetical protein
MYPTERPTILRGIVRCSAFAGARFLLPIVRAFFTARTVFLWLGTRTRELLFPTNGILTVLAATIETCCSGTGTNSRKTQILPCSTAFGRICRLWFRKEILWNEPHGEFVTATQVQPWVAWNLQEVELGLLSLVELVYIR